MEFFLAYYFILIFNLPFLFPHFVDGNKFVGVGSLGSQEPYNSEAGRTGTMYGYGTFTINSATVATWTMWKNSQIGTTIAATSLDSLLICNTFNTGSAICPYTSIPVTTATTTYVFAQVIHHLF